MIVRSIQTGVGHTDKESAQQFWLEKTLKDFSCAPDGARTTGPWISSPTLYYQQSHPVAPII